MTTRPDDPVHPVSGGLTKREYFAALAMQGLIATPDRGSYRAYAQDAVEYADALIAALNEEPQP